ncbi:MAG TPA: amino acid ABC transporter substrate-binding protein [Symbiobacteriaceae bacterium]|nr:amino acid ABC transporter substrate-binding protein [Symbiobacteriaceae bacterium]
MQKQRKLLAAGVSMVLMLMLVAGCGGTKTETQTQTPSGSAAPAPEKKEEITEIRLGAAFPLTGKESKIGASFKLSTELAIKEVNDAGGLEINGKKVPIKLTLLDDTTDPTKSAQLIEQLITQDKVHAIVGGYSTLLVSAQSVVPERYGIPYVNGGGASTSTYGRSKWVFGTLSPIDVLARTQMEFLKDLVDSGKLPKPLAIATVWENTEHGKDYQKGIVEFANKNPGDFKVVFNEGFELYAASFKPLLTKVQNAKADIFMADARLEDYITMHREYSQMGLSHKMVTYGPRGADKAARDGLGDKTDYIFASAWWANTLPYPQVKAYVEKYKAATGIASPAWYDALPYETVRILLKAIQQAGSTDPEKIRQALTKVEIKDSLVPGQVLKFSETGQAIYPYVVTQNKPGNKLDLVWPKEAKNGDAVAPIPTK